MTLLDVKHVQKIYKTRFQGNQVEALKDIHFTVEKGDYVAIMGESGSGKSTLLNILAMLDKPSRGQVYLNGTDTATINPNHSYLSQLDVTYKTPDLMSHFLPPHEVSFTFCCSSIVFPR